MKFYPGATCGRMKTHRIVGHYDVSAAGAVSGLTCEGASTIAKTAEGKHKLSLDDSFGGGLLAASISAGGWICGIENDTSTDVDDPHVDLLFSSHTTGTPSDTDPDSVTVYFSLLFARSSE